MLSGRDWLPELVGERRTEAASADSSLNHTGVGVLVLKHHLAVTSA